MKIDITYLKGINRYNYLSEAHEHLLLFLLIRREGNLSNRNPLNKYNILSNICIPSVPVENLNLGMTNRNVPGTLTTMSNT